VLGLPPNLTVSEVGRLGFHNEWYDYDAKYSEGGSWLEVPADLPAETSERLRATAASAFTLCDCHGMARVDFFLTHEGRLVLNEINTIPGFTATSYYARMFEASGIAYGDLLTRLVELALERFAAESSLLR
jgi:D-alanine-D-alanine ligase